MPNTTVVRSGLVVDVKRRSADPADLLIQDATITSIGPHGIPAPDDATVIDAGDRIIIPGLVNAHTHSHANLPRSLGDRWTLELALNGNPAARQSTTADDKYLGAMLGAVEMVRKGCTACYDLFLEFPGPSVDGLTAVGQAYADIGLRAVVAPMMSDISFYDAIPGLRATVAGDADSTVAAPQSWDKSLQTVQSALRAWPFDSDQLRLALAPTIPLHCSDELMVAASRLARKHGIGWHTHLAESKVQAITGMKRYGCTLTAHLQSIGVLGPEFTAAHGVWLDDEDMTRLADAGCCVAHNPVSNMRYGSGMADIAAMRRVGVTVGVGTDSRSCSDNLNMFEAMRTALYTTRVCTPDYRHWLGSAEALEMATAGSARTLGMADQIGVLAPGYKADMVFLDRNNLNYVPLNDVINQIVMAEDGTGIAAVMINGRMVFENGRVTTVDEASLVARVEKAWERLRAANADRFEKARKLEDAVGAFCVDIANTPYHIHRYCGGL